jgi:predicted amidophosphoribosyltransferase
MATYHEVHSFEAGMLTQVWNPKNCKREWQPSRYFCAVCGRKQDHILHTNRVPVVEASRFTDPAYLKTERSVARSQKAIRRAV